MSQISTKRVISFSPPDITDLEIEEVISVLKTGWITTGPRTKLLERRLAAYIETGDNTIDCDAQDGIEKYSKSYISGTTGMYLSSSISTI